MPAMKQRLPVDFDLARELELRDVSAAELARATGLSKVVIRAYVRGFYQPRAERRRALRAALKRWPVIEVDGHES